MALDILSFECGRYPQRGQLLKLGPLIWINHYCKCVKHSLHVAVIGTVAVDGEL